ncbi:hypothetical protein KBY96_03250 [Cyanobium sp. ATX 6A2]|uniref:hypothetical protein n=1 Tax=Cyanobium sp. ATX 6A2 TaxID=2823700 RepID=UPI0020CE7610|nr:hypothetical protein [Cyanobium sp. ATX 6A2]MCP9886951.1 hypothetical protein [Cyanobium sp. ATX 6A2]
MAADPLDALRLTLMQDVLPVGMAMVERARQGGPQQVMAAFDGSSADPLGQLRQEGEPAASRVRAQLDQVSPGLGNPVMQVEVRDVGEQPACATASAAATATPSTSATFAEGGVDAIDPLELEQRLAAIAARLQQLEQAMVPPGSPEAGDASR